MPNPVVFLALITILGHVCESGPTELTLTEHLNSLYSDSTNTSKGLEPFCVDHEGTHISVGGGFYDGCNHCGCSMWRGELGGGCTLMFCYDAIPTQWICKDAMGIPKTVHNFNSYKAGCMPCTRKGKKQPKTPYEECYGTPLDANESKGTLVSDTTVTTATGTTAATTTDTTAATATVTTAETATVTTAATTTVCSSLIVVSLFVVIQSLVINNRW